MSDLYFDKQGRPITLHQFSALFNDMRYKRVAYTELETVVISTVWLGIDHSYGFGGPPILFETMVFSKEQWRAKRAGLTDLDVDRYSTEEEALLGHEVMVKRAKKRFRKQEMWARLQRVTRRPHRRSP